MIQREIYLKQLIRAKDNGLPKVVPAFEDVANPLCLRIFILLG